MNNDKEIETCYTELDNIYCKLDSLDNSINDIKEKQLLLNKSLKILNNLEQLLKINNNKNIPKKKILHNFGPTKLAISNFTFYQNNDSYFEIRNNDNNTKFMYYRDRFERYNKLNNDLIL